MSEEIPDVLRLSPLSIHSLLKKYGFVPKKSLGQNFLVDDHALQRIVTLAKVPKGATVLEIGAGMGSLTRYLASVASEVLAVELDSRLEPILNEVLKSYNNTRVIIGDILALPLNELLQNRPYTVVANIPYYLTSLIIRRLLEAENKPESLTLTIQEEVAWRICASQGEMSLLALSVQVYGKPSLVANLPASYFFPTPKVDSAVLHIQLYETPLIPLGQLDDFFHITRAAFSQKRKTLRNALAAGLRLTPGASAQLLVQAGIDPQRRAETLSLDEWANLCNVYRL